MIREFSFRGKPYKVSCVETSPDHPSWFTYEDEAVVRERFWRIDPDDVVFDIGAAYGSYSLTALASGAAKVFAWSPQGQPGEQAEVDFLRTSLQLNGWSRKVSLYQEGLYDHTGYLNTMTQEFVQESHSVGGDWIRVMAMDDYYMDDVKPGNVWMKLDVEGAEVHVLRGAAKLIQRLRPRILIENHNFKDPTLEAQVRELLTGLKYIEEATMPYHAVSHSLYLP